MSNKFLSSQGNNDIIGLLDYGDSIYAPTVCELSVGLAYSLMNTKIL